MVETPSTPSHPNLCLNSEAGGHIDKALIFDYVQQVIVVDDLLWYICYVEFHILWIWESIVEVKILTSAKTHFAAGVDTTLLNRHLAVVVVAVGVVSVPE